MERIIIIGNSGSGKSTFAKKLSREKDIPHLDLDVFAFDSTGLRKDINRSLNEISSFINENHSWIIEGCYGDLLEKLSAHATKLYFLNPGVDACANNNKKRPFEKHKYNSPEEQNENLNMLQNWVKEYETRTDEYSYKKHKEIYNNFSGGKEEYTVLKEYM